MEKVYLECTQLAKKASRGLQYLVLLLNCYNQIGGSVVLFGKNRVLKLPWLTKLYERSEYNLATKGQFQNPYFSQIAQLTHISRVNSVPIVE